MKAKLDETDEDFANLTQHREFYKAMYKGDDDDAFFDRTGRVEKKREKNKKSARGGKVTETYETLIAKQKVVLAQKKLVEADITELEKLIAVEKTELKPDENIPNDDLLDSFMSDISSSLLKDKLSMKKKLLNEIIKEHDRITSFANLVKPALSGLSDTGSFTEAQLKSVAQYEEEWKKKKIETDNDTRDRDAEKQKLVRDQMKQLAHTSRGSLKSRKLQPKSTDLGPTHETSSPENTNTEDITLTNETIENMADTHQSPLLSGVAKVIEKQKKRRKKKGKNENLQL